ncbi:hypothetical protein OF83DRAFT_1186763 [Amylostereum chailletii]|nr:hypothetical protein OF83DRAFT_1186763 [Amylostereum chailletii]
MLNNPRFTHQCLRWSCQHLSSICTRRVLARILSTLLCSVIIVIRPFSRLGGSSAFLVLTLKELVFAVQETLPQQVEATVLNTMGALIGIATSTLARFISMQFPDNSAAARAIPIVFLIAIAFSAGLAKSALPRLQMSAQICCFLSIFILTTHPGASEGELATSGNYLWVTLSAACICLLSSFLLLPWFVAPFAEDVATAFLQLHQALSARLDETLMQDMSRKPSHQRRVDDLLRRSIQLNASYSRESFELRVGRLSVKSLKPFIGIVEYLRREIAWGRSTARHFHDKDSIAAFEPTILALGHSTLTAMQAVATAVHSSYNNHVGELVTRSLREERSSIILVRERLLMARDGARDHLRGMFGSTDESSNDSLEDLTRKVNELKLSQERWDYCLFTISLLQMAQEMLQALIVADKTLALYEQSHVRLWYPRLTMAWLGMAPPTVVMDDRAAPPDDPVPIDSGRRLSSTEAQQGLAEHLQFFNSRDAAVARAKIRASNTYPAGWGPWSFSLYRLWSTVPVLRARLALSPILRSFTHSKHLHHALKNAIGVALLSLPAFFPEGSAGQKFFTEVHGQWMVISYVWVLQTNTGATWRIGYLRISGTIIGAIYAYITYLICHSNPYGLVAMVTLADVPISYIITCTSISSLGVVANVTLPPIVFAPYVINNSTSSVTLLALWRGAMISTGIVSALIMNTALFPRHCRILFLRSTSQTLGMLSQLYLMLGRYLFQKTQPFVPKDTRQIMKMELNIRNSLSRLSYFIVTMDDELSLVPKPMQQYRKAVAALQDILDIMTGLRKVRENIPVKETVSSVFCERREFVSCICLSLYACEHAFRARQPFPQFLPSARLSLSALLSHIEESLGAARSSPEDSGVKGMSLVYVLAESEVLKDLVDAMENLLSVCRALFGTATWLIQDSRQSEGFGFPRETDGDGVRSGWYSN